MSTILAALIITAISAGTSYGVTNWFWTHNSGTETDSSGAFLGSRSWSWTVMSGVVVSMLLTLYVGKHFIAESMLMWTFGVSAITAMLAGFAAAWRHRS